MRKRMIAMPGLAALIVVVAMSSVRPALGAPNHSSGQLDGTWRINVQPSPQSGLPPVLNFASFTKDGRIVNIDPGVGTAVGEWEKRGGHDYAVTFTGFAAFNGQTVQYKVRGELTVDESGTQFSGAFRSDIADLNGNLLFSVDGTALATRMEVEPL